jgi:hypothetical protein
MSIIHKEKQNNSVRFMKLMPFCTLLKRLHDQHLNLRHDHEYLYKYGAKRYVVLNCARFLLKHKILPPMEIVYP